MAARKKKPARKKTVRKAVGRKTPTRKKPPAKKKKTTRKKKAPTTGRDPQGFRSTPLTEEEFWMLADIAFHYIAFRGWKKAFVYQCLRDQAVKLCDPIPELNMKHLLAIYEGAIEMAKEQVDIDPEEVGSRKDLIRTCIERLLGIMNDHASPPSAVAYATKQLGEFIGAQARYNQGSGTDSPETIASQVRAFLGAATEQVEVVSEEELKEPDPDDED